MGLDAVNAKITRMVDQILMIAIGNATAMDKAEEGVMAVMASVVAAVMLTGAVRGEKLPEGVTIQLADAAATLIREGVDGYLEAKNEAGRRADGQGSGG